MAYTSSRSSSSSDSEVDSWSKSCLESVKARLVHYKKNETVFEKSINVLKLEVRLRDNALDAYKLNLEKAEAERQLKQTLEKFQNSSKSLNEILECQVINKFKKGLGYDAGTAASPAVEDFMNLTDKSGSDKAYHVVPPPLSRNFLPGKPDLTFLDEIMVRKKTVFPTVSKIEFVGPKQPEKPVRKPVKYAKMYKSQRSRGNQRNWNNQKSQQLGSNFVMYNKACFVCGSFDHLKKDCSKRMVKPVWNNARRVNHQNSPRITHPNPKINMVPRKILTRQVNTARQKAMVNVVRTNQFNAVKASACWVWRPGNPEIELEDLVRLNSLEDKKLVYVRYNGYGIDCIEVSWPCDGSIEDLDVLLVDLE
ncbi:ribonuclease H-like domain-containing protein [Tanacetum coccineum]